MFNFLVFCIFYLGNSNHIKQSFPPWMYKKSDTQRRSFTEIPLRPKNLRADILHKNSFYYNQVPTIKEASSDNHYSVLKSVAEHNCEWKECRAKFISSKDLLRHVQEEHLSCLPLHTPHEHPQQHLVCRWRQCKDIRCYPARYKLLLHLQRHHCNDRATNKVRIRTPFIQASD